MNPVTILLIALMIGAATKGKRKILIRSPVRGKVGTKFGWRIHPFSKKKQFHRGVDIGLPTGTPVYSPMDGIVLSRLTGKAGGRQLVISHPKGYRSGYAHLSQRLVKKGERVKRGDLIASTGNTGKSTAPHLHFTWRKDGKPQDPERYFKF